jgi:uncharacterized protein (DUF885 family)
MKKILVLMLSALLLLSGCTSKDPTPKEVEDDPGVVYIDQLKNFEVRKKNVNNTVDDPEFDKFLDEVFVYFMESDYLTMHFNVIDYQKYGIEKPELSVGTVDYDDDSGQEDYEKMLEELEAFDFDKLSYRQQYDYESLKYSLLETIASTYYSHYQPLFNSSSDILGNLITNFTEFVFRSKTDIDDYLVLLADVDRYLDDCLTYTARQAEDGVGLIDYAIDYETEFAQRFTAKVDDNELITTFDEKIDTLDFLNKAEKEEYKLANAKIVKEEVIPEYQKVDSELRNYYGKTPAKDMALCNLNKNYAELTFILNGSSNEDIDTLFQNAKDEFDLMVAEYFTATYNKEAISEYQTIHQYGTDAFNFNSSRDYLEFLRQNLDDYYPDLGAVDYTVDELDPSTASDSILAYYMPCPVDDSNQNVIRTNPNTLSEDPVETYNTLAHEGFPGHLYQHVFYSRTNPHVFRSTQDFIGYTEGYAVNASYDALKMACENEDTANLLGFECNFYFLFYSVIDMGVNYYGWTAKDIDKYADEFGLFNSKIGESMYDFIIDMSGVYDHYGLGHASFRQLRRYAMEQLGDDFDMVEYNRTILKNGPLPFNILKGAVDEYIASAK